MRATLTIDLGYQDSRFDSGREKIIVVDVDKKYLPESITMNPNTEFYKADVPSTEKNQRAAREKYAFMLATKYAKEAKLVITGRIHSALPAAAQGVPVIFVVSKKLPGGGGGRTGGLVELFHQFAAGSNFTFDPDNMEPNPGIHKIDRYRASFWNYFKRRSQVYEDSGKLYGHLPLKRLGISVATHADESHDLFHMIYTTTQISWRVIRAVEYIFYHHPNAKVVVHSNTLPKDNDFLRFVEAGYKLVVREYELEYLIDQCNADGQSKRDFLQRLPHISKGKYWYSHETDLLRAMVLYIWGGVYLDTDMYILKPLLKSDLQNTWSCQSSRAHDANVAMLIFDQGSPMLLRYINRYLGEYNQECWGCNGPQLLYRVYREPEYQQFSSPQKDYTSFYPYTWHEVHKCFDEKTSFDWFNNTRFSNSWALHLNTKLTSNYISLEQGTICYDVLQRFCIFCDEIH